MRMVNRKSMVIGALFALVMIANIAFVPAFATKTVEQTNMPIAISEPVAKDLKQINGTEPTKEQVKFVFEAIKASNLTYKEKNDLMKNLEDIWSGESTLRESEKQEVIVKAATIVFDYYRIDEKEVGVLWNGDVHSDLAQTAGIKWGTGYYDVLYNHASDPDTWGIWQQWQHYSWGGAGDKCKLFADSARDKIKNQSDPIGGYTDLSVSMHYMSDVANPWHTKPLEYQLHHTDYENYVSGNWTAGVTYYNDVNNNWYYYYVSDPKASVDNLASVSTQYFGYIDSKISQGGDWGNDATVIDDTRTVLLHAIRYDMGIVDYIRR